MFEVNFPLINNYFRRMTFRAGHVIRWFERSRSHALDNLAVLVVTQLGCQLIVHESKVVL